MLTKRYDTTQTFAAKGGKAAAHASYTGLGRPSCIISCQHVVVAAAKPAPWSVTVLLSQNSPYTITRMFPLAQTTYSIPADRAFSCCSLPQKSTHILLSFYMLLSAPNGDLCFLGRFCLLQSKHDKTLG